MRQVAPTWAESELLTEVRCPRCNRLLFKGQVIQVEIKCPKCHLCQNITTVKHCFSIEVEAACQTEKERTKCGPK
jgi:phage FluMu protein Com